MRTLFHSLRRRIGAAVGGEASDDELLAAYLDSRSESAFERIVHRHGPMVFGVCRRGAATPTDAEDAFQAVWVVLVQKAANVRPRAMLGNWLYGVAVNVTRRAKLAAARRLNRERRAAEPESETVTPPDGLAAVLDEEIARLPDAYRAAVLACDVDGLPRSAAAHRLGWREGTVASRLSRGRELLAKRLLRRGIGPAVVGVFAVPDLLASKALAALGDTAVSPAVAELARGAAGELALRSVARTLVYVAAGTVVAVGVALGYGLSRGRESAAEPTSTTASGGVQTAPMPRRVPDSPTPRVIVNPANDIRVVTVRDEAMPQFFRRQKVVVAGLLEEKLTPLFTATKPSDPLFVGYAAYNHKPLVRVYGDTLRIAPPTPAVIELLTERLRDNTDRAQLNLIYVADPADGELFHLAGYTTRNTVSFFTGKRVEPDPYSPAEFEFQPPKK